MQACIISLTVIVKMDFISCCFICLETVSSFVGDFGQVIYGAVIINLDSLLLACGIKLLTVLQNSTVLITCGKSQCMINEIK